jgi:hypothetical protein
MLNWPPPTGTYKVLLVPVLEKNQTFSDPDQTNLINAMRTGILAEVISYFEENSFGQLHVQFDFFGGQGGTPVELPDPVATYFNGHFEPGGLDLHAPSNDIGLGFDTVRFDGTERLKLLVTPRQRPQPPSPLEVTFSALTAESTHPGTLQQDVQLPSGNPLKLQVTDKNDVQRDVTVPLTTKTVTVTAAKVNDNLKELEDHLAGQFAAASVSPPLATGTLLQRPRLRRLRTDNPDALGRLVLDLAIHPDSAGGDAGIIVQDPGGLAILGLAASMGSSSFQLPGSGTLGNRRFAEYLQQRLELSQEAAGFPGGNRLLAGSVVVTSNPGIEYIISRIRLSQLDGGAGASLEIVEQVGLDTKIGASAPLVAPSVQVPGVSTAGDSDTVLDDVKILNDVLKELNDKLGSGDQTSWFTAPSRDYRCICVVLFKNAPTGVGIGAAPTLKDQRMFKAWRTAVHSGNSNIQLLGNWVVTSVDNSDPGKEIGRFCHELSHTLGSRVPPGPIGPNLKDDWVLGLADTYDNDPENQTGLRYFGAWDLMSAHTARSHLAGFHKRHLGWIPSDRIEPVDGAGAPAGECWLVPIEHWRPNMVQNVQAAVGDPNAKVKQLMEIVLPGDGGRFLLIEARAPGTKFSKALPFTPPTPAGATPTAGLVVTDGINYSDPQRYVVDYKYRRYAHPLNNGIRDSDGPSPNVLWKTATTFDNKPFDLGTVPTLTEKGYAVKVADTKEVGGIPVFQVKFDRAAGNTIDLLFRSTVPPWTTPDVWIDWPGDGREPRPKGTPLDQGNPIRVKKTTKELNEIVARVHNDGSVQALSVVVRFYIWGPPGSGSINGFRFVDSVVIPSINPGAYQEARGRWEVAPGSTEHCCVLAQISDWDVPKTTSGPIPIYQASTDLHLHNNRAQKNLSEFELLEGSPYSAVSTIFEVANDGPDDALVYLEPYGLPQGFRLTCAPRNLRVPAHQVGQFAVTIDADRGAVAPGAGSDVTFLLNTCRWTRDRTNVEPFGGWKLTLRPRQRATLTIISAANTTTGVVVTGTVAGGTPNDVVWVCLDAIGFPVRWQRVVLLAGGGFTVNMGPVQSGLLGGGRVEVHFDGNSQFGRAVAGPVTVPGGGPNDPDGIIPWPAVVAGPVPPTAGHHEQVDDDES